MKLLLDYLKQHKVLLIFIIVALIISIILPVYLISRWLSAWDASIKYRKAYTLYEEGRYEEAIELYETIKPYVEFPEQCDWMIKNCIEEMTGRSNNGVQ